MKVLVIDNYDSFTYNLVHYLEELGAEVTVRRNDDIETDHVKEFKKILFSPGPGLSSEVPLMHDILYRCGNTSSILGICLGHQAIAEAFGASLVNLKEPCHGKSIKTIVTDTEDYLFKKIPGNFYSGRYHSWIVDPKSLPDSLIVTSVDPSGRIMSLRHRQSDIRGVQFHPESIMTEYGKLMILNWLRHRAV